MAIPLSKVQKTINADLKKININIKSFQAQDYKDNPEAKELEYMYSDEFRKLVNGRIICSTSERMDRIRAKEKQLKKVAILYDSKLSDIEKSTKLKQIEFEWLLDINIYNATASILGLTKNTLIHKIKHADYAHAYKPEYENEHSYIQHNIDIWIHYCDVVDNIVLFIKREFPNWGGMSLTEKNKYIKTWKLIAKAPFVNDSLNLKYFIWFLEDRYALNQATKAKADCLLGQNLPNIDTYKIAEEVCKNTNLKYKFQREETIQEF